MLAVPDTWLRARRNVLGVADYLNEYPGPDDLRLFVNEYRSDGTSATWQISGGDEPLLRVPSSAGSCDVSCMCNLFAQLGVHGASILFVRSDDGVGAGD